jgi:hypothetical protein
MNKSTTAVAALVAATAFGTAGIANAATVTHRTTIKKITTTNTSYVNGMNPITTTLAGLVSKGTITQAQSDAIVAALNAARTAHPASSLPQGAPSVNGDHGFGGPRGGAIAQDQSVILSTLGITAATLQADRAAGQSLATIAGTNNTQALITALVAADTTQINAQVAAGKITQAQATQMISGLTTRVTVQVNAVPGKGFAGMRNHGAPLAPGTPAPGNN